MATPPAGGKPASRYESAAQIAAGEIESEHGAAEATDDESSISPAAREAELTLDIVGTFDAMAQVHRKLHRLQHQRITALSKCEVLPWTTERCYDKLRLESIELLKRVRLSSTRIEHLVEQLYELNRRLVGEEGRLLRLAETVGVRRREFLEHYMGNELAADWLERVGALPDRGWACLPDKAPEIANHRTAIAQIAAEVKLPIAEFRRVVQTRSRPICVRPPPRCSACLTPRQERILRMRFGIGMDGNHTLEEVGKQFSVTRVRIRQIEAKALRKLKHPHHSRKLRTFLDI